MKAIKSYILWVFQNVPLHVKQGQLSYICCILVHVERSLFTEAATGGTLKRCSYKFRKIQRKTPVPESLFNKVAGGACNFVETCASLLTTEYLNRILGKYFFNVLLSLPSLLYYFCKYVQHLQKAVYDFSKFCVLSSPVVFVFSFIQLLRKTTSGTDGERGFRLSMKSLLLENVMKISMISILDYIHE